MLTFQAVSKLCEFFYYRSRSVGFFFRWFVISHKSNNSFLSINYFVALKNDTECITDLDLTKHDDYYFWVTFDHFLKQAVLFETAAGVAAKIGLSLKPNDYNQFKPS